MIGFIVSAMLVLVVGFWLCERALGGDRAATVAMYLALFLIWGLVLNVATKSEDKGPCYEKEPSHDN